MQPEITLKPMTPDMYHAYFKEYQDDADAYLNQDDFKPYQYEKARTDAYIQRQMVHNRLPLAIMYGDEIAGELKFYDIVPGESATLGIAMKNAAYKNRGFGTKAEQLAVKYVFEVLDIPVLYAACVITNTRSQHVLEKVGFQFLYEENSRRHYRMVRPDT